jgi:anti-anti-sigma factor
MPDDTSASFRLEGGVLICPFDMNTIPPKQLRDWCDKLLESPQSLLAVDMSGTRHIASHHLGIIAQAWADAIGKGKKMVVRASRELTRVFEMSGLDQIFDLAEN